MKPTGGSAPMRGGQEDTEQVEIYCNWAMGSSHMRWVMRHRWSG